MVMGAAGLVDNLTVATAVLIVLSAWATAVNVPAVRWRRAIGRRATRFERRRQLEKDTYLHRNSRDLYGFRQALALGDDVSTGRNVRLVERVVRVDRLDPADRARGMEAAERWAAMVGAFAYQACRQYRLPLRMFLQTNHLALIRDGALAEPFLVWRAVAGAPVIDEVSDETAKRDRFGVDLVPWALALRDLARRYNAVARQQREPVTFLHKPGEEHIGVVLRPPPQALGPALSVVDWMSPWFQLHRVRRRLAARRFATAVRGARHRMAADDRPPRDPHSF